MEADDEAVDVLLGVVEVEAGAGRSVDAEAGMERLGAMVAGADANGGLVEDGADVVWMDAVEREGDDAAAIFGRRAVGGQAGNLAESSHGVVGQSDLVITNGVEADLVHARRVQVVLLRPSWVGILSPW